MGFEGTLDHEVGDNSVEGGSLVFVGDSVGGVGALADRREVFDCLWCGLAEKINNDVPSFLSGDIDGECHLVGYLFLRP